jgi:hypothetical protein
LGRIPVHVVGEICEARKKLVEVLHDDGRSEREGRHENDVRWGSARPGPVGPSTWPSNLVVDWMIGSIF